MNERQLPRTNFPETEFPNYNDIFQHRIVFYSRIETLQLRSYVDRLIEGGMIEVKVEVTKPDGSKDRIIQWKSEPKK